MLGRLFHGGDVVHDPSNSNETPQFGQVLKFRLRRGVPPPLRRRPAMSPVPNADHDPVDDLAQYEQEEEGEINYRHRMLMNVIAVVIVSLLVGLGVWIADTIADMQRIQDCTMQGRQNCAPIDVPVPKQ
jgi:hypothetical protein